MPIHNDSLGPTLPQNVPSHGPVRKALLNLAVCGCLQEWKDFLHLSKGRVYCALECLRIRLCISEQCWDSDLVSNASLSVSDRCVPYPKSVHHALTSKLHIAKNIKKDAYDHASEKRRLLQVRHNSCPSRYGRDLKMAFKFVNSEVKKYGDNRRAEILDEVKTLIRCSPWQRMVNPSKVRNLAFGKVSTEELELLSLGGDFKLQIGDRSYVDVAAAFHGFDNKYCNDPAKPDLHRVKTELMSNISKDRMKVLPRRYIDAIKSLKSNSDIKICFSDKGKETVMCYRATYLNLVTNHYSNTTFYTPVENTDMAGHDLEHMVNDLKEDLSGFVMRAPDKKHKNIIKGLFPPTKARFPLGRCNLKTHKSNITEDSIPVRPIISNTNSPTSNLASFLGKCLTKNLGVVSNKHLGSTETFANFVKDCTSRGKLMSLDVEQLFTCIPTDCIISFLRNKSGGWGDTIPPEPEKVAAEPVYSFNMDAKIFCDLVELSLSYNQFKVEGNFFRQTHGLFMGVKYQPP